MKMQRTGGHCVEEISVQIYELNPEKLYGTLQNILSTQILFSLDIVRDYRHIWIQRC